MASPMPNPPQGGWNNNGQTMQQNNDNETGVQVRPMGRMQPPLRSRRSLSC
jgi:hypothetical protein